MSRAGPGGQARVADLDTEPAPPAAPNESAGSSHIGTLLADRYRVDQLLGEGGMGQVYRAEHVHMRKTVAVKVLHRELTLHSEIVARFEREAVAAARVEHPHVAAATDFGRLQDGSFYLVLEFVEGQSLTALLRTSGRLPVPRALAITRQIADALGAAHEAGIVHRDLKPDNVMLVGRDDDVDFVKVLDFGIAKVQNDDSTEQPVLTKVGTVFGTPEYMAPEQAQGGVADTRADLYTLGMMLYEMLSGSTAFRDDQLLVVLTRQMTAEPAPLPADVDPAVSDLVMTLLKKKPEERIQTAAELGVRLDQLLRDGAPVSSEGVRSELSSQSATSARGARQLAIAAGERVRHAAELIHARVPGWKSALKKPVRIGSRQLALWLVLAAGCSLLTLIAVASELFRSSTAEEAAGRPAREVSAAEPAAEVRIQELIDRAKQGDRAALGELRPLAQKRARAWLALGEGYASIQHFEASLGAYATAIELEPALAGDAQLLDAVWAAAKKPSQLASALDLAERLGATGVDLIHALWLEFRGDKQRKASAEAAKLRLDKPTVVANMSTALRVALDLNEAKGCKAYKKVMPAAAQYADARSLAKLQPLLHTSGCGFLGLRDCYSCLRNDKDFGQALARARAESAPAFGAAAELQPTLGSKSQTQRKKPLSRAGRQ